jgi:hypothetical protein
VGYLVIFMEDERGEESIARWKRSNKRFIRGVNVDTILNEIGERSHRPKSGNEEVPAGADGQNGSEFHFSVFSGILGFLWSFLLFANSSETDRKVMRLFSNIDF